MLAGFGRLLLVVVASIVALAAGGFVVVTLGLERLTQAAHKDGDFETLAAIILVLRNGAAISVGLAILPALLLIVAGEVARISSSMFYIVGGGVAAAAIPVIANWQNAGRIDVLPPSPLLQVLATAGFLAGFIYWLLAGRTRR